MTTSALPDILDALYDLARTNAPDHVMVVDGPGSTDDASQGLLWVGMDDPQSFDYTNANGATQTVTVLGTLRSRDDELTIPCVAFSYNGDKDMAAARRDAYEIFGTVETFIREDPWLGFLNAGKYRSVTAQIADHTLQQQQDADGAKALVVFNVYVKVRI